MRRAMSIKNRQPFIIMIIAAILWVAAFPVFKQDFLEKFYFMPFLGIIAATVANTTPAAAGIVYFPILTRLSIAPMTAVQFSLIIQAYGMGLGTLRWFMINRRLFLTNVLPICVGGGMIGVFLSIIVFPVTNPAVLTLIFNFIAFLFTQIIFFSILFNRQYPRTQIELNFQRLIFLGSISILGGLISGWIGFGIDTIFYFVLTLFFQINPAIAIVTSISLMAAMSIFGTALNLIVNQVPLSLWYSAIPGVTVAGLFLAAYLAMKLGAKNVLLLFTIFLSLDFFMTLWTQHAIPMTETMRLGLIYGLVTYLVLIHVKIFKSSYKEIGSALSEFSPAVNMERTEINLTEI